MTSSEKRPLVLRRLRREPLGSGQETLFGYPETPQLPISLDTISDVRIERRLGNRPLHLNCGCPLAWLKVVVPETYQGEAVGTYKPGDLVYAQLSTRVIADSANTYWQDQVKSLGPDGGIASYELLVSLKESWAQKSMHYALWQSGMRFTDNPFNTDERLAIQEPIPGLESPPLSLPPDQDRLPDWQNVGGPTAGKQAA